MVLKLTNVKLIITTIHLTHNLFSRPCYGLQVGCPTYYTVSLKKIIETELSYIVGLYMLDSNQATFWYFYSDLINS